MKILAATAPIIAAAHGRNHLPAMYEEQLFLSPSNDRFRDMVRNDPDAQPWLDLVDDLVRTGLALLNEIEAPTNHAAKFSSAAIFARAHQSVQSAVIVIERGAVIDGRALLRTVVEGAIALNAFASDPDDFVEKLTAQSRADQFKITDMLLNKPDLRAEVSSQDIARLEKIRSDILAMKPEERRGIIWEQVAAKHCPDLYDTMYRLLSMHGTHVNVHSIANQFERDELADAFTLMKVGPDPAGLVSALQFACGAYLHALEPFVKLYPIPGYAEKVDAFATRLKEMKVREMQW